MNRTIELDIMGTAMETEAIVIKFGLTTNSHVFDQESHQLGSTGSDGRRSVRGVSHTCVNSAKQAADVHTVDIATALQNPCIFTLQLT